MKGDFNNEDEGDERKSLVYMNHWHGMVEPAAAVHHYKWIFSPQLAPEQKRINQLLTIYIKQYICAIKTSHRVSCWQSEEKRKFWNSESVSVFTFTLEKMFAESEENGKDLLETLVPS